MSVLPAAALRALFAGQTVTSAPGGHYAFDELVLLPPPVQEQLPIMIGGKGPKVTLRLTAEHANIWHGFGTPAEWAASSSMRVSLLSSSPSRTRGAS